MKSIITFTIILMALAACSTPQTQVVIESPATDIPQVGMPNPASVFCSQKGNKLVINTAPDGSQNGVCVFPDGNSCDEWAFYRGECGLLAQKSPTPELAGEAPVITTEAGAEGNNGAGGYMPPGTSEEFSDWWGIIKSTEPGAQFDDYFERQDMGGVIYFGIDSMDQEVKDQIESLRDSGKIVHLYGKLSSNVPDYNGSQVQVDRIEVEE